MSNFILRIEPKLQQKQLVQNHPVLITETWYWSILQRDCSYIDLIPTNYTENWFHLEKGTRGRLVRMSTGLEIGYCERGDHFIIGCSQDYFAWSMLLILLQC